MKLCKVDGLWQLHPGVATGVNTGADTGDDTPGPNLNPLLTIGVEAEGTLLTWPLGSAPGTSPHITFYDAEQADWLWMLIGTDSHVEVLRAINAGTEREMDIAFDPAATLAAHRFAHVHYLRHWWPASVHDGRPQLDETALTCELAVLAEDLDWLLGQTASVTEYLEALRPADVVALSHSNIEAVRTVAQRALHLLELAGQEVDVAPTSRPSDFALAAGATGKTSSAAIARGVAPLAWQGVPAGIFDATERAVSWSVEARQNVELTVAVALLPRPRLSPAGIGVAAELDGLEQTTDVLDDKGRAIMELPMSPEHAWQVDWDTLHLTVGVKVAESPSLRDRVRGFADSRLTDVDDLTCAAEELAIDEDF